MIIHLDYFIRLLKALDANTTQVSELLGQLQQATTGDDVTKRDEPIAMDAIDAIINHDGHD